MSFEADTAEEAKAWQRRFRDQIKNLLGPTPPEVPLNPEIVEEVDMGHYVRRKVVYDSEAYASVPAYLLIPKGIKPGEKRPAILAAHGHGNGKIDICGVVSSDEHRDLIKQLNYDYAHQFAVRGYVVIAPDWRGFGERACPPEWVRPTRDQCNVNYMAYGYQGYHLLALQVFDAMRTLDYLQSLPEVDPERIGCVGLSFGGTMTTYMAALEPRIKVACVSGYLSTIIGDAIGMRGLGNFCGAQYMPGLLKYGDIPDVGALIAPKPLVVEMGEKDSCFVIEDMKVAYNYVRRAYEVMGAADLITADIHPGEHMWSGRVAYDWFERYL
jgi:dienelactone hydrolase